MHAPHLMEATPARQCTARSKQSRQRCRRRPIPGGLVCVMHGGKAPQVQRTAKERIAALVDPAIDALQRALRHRDIRAAIQAARDLLDRAGFSVRQQIEVQGQVETPTLMDLIHASTVESRVEELVGEREPPPWSPADEYTRAFGVVQHQGEVFACIWPVWQTPPPDRQYWRRVRRVGERLADPPLELLDQHPEARRPYYQERYGRARAAATGAVGAAEGRGTARAVTSERAAAPVVSAPRADAPPAWYESGHAVRDFDP